jgi:hypothetical protein
MGQLKTFDTYRPNFSTAMSDSGWSCGPWGLTLTIVSGEVDMFYLRPWMLLLSIETSEDVPCFSFSSLSSSTLCFRLSISNRSKTLLHSSSSFHNIDIPLFPFLLARPFPFI